jgi:hypothetical protein
MQGSMAGKREDLGKAEKWKCRGLARAEAQQLHGQQYLYCTVVFSKSHWGPARACAHAQILTCAPALRLVSITLAQSYGGSRQVIFAGRPRALRDATAAYDFSIGPSVELSDAGKAFPLSLPVEVSNDSFANFCYPSCPFPGPCILRQNGTRKCSISYLIKERFYIGFDASPFHYHEL